MTSLALSSAATLSIAELSDAILSARSCATPRSEAHHSNSADLCLWLMLRHRSSSSSHLSLPSMLLNSFQTEQGHKELLTGPSQEKQLTKLLHLARQANKKHQP